ILALAGRMAADPDKTPSKSSEQRAKQTGSAAAPDAGNTAGGGYLQKNPLPSSFEPSPGEPGFDRLQTNEDLSNLPKRVHVPANINPSPARYGIGGEIKLFPISGE
ncbi:MAG: hypothetical protein Q8P95_04505, partial [bacterium]|nr:hypothetical protein [bacterium]